MNMLNRVINKEEMSVKPVAKLWWFHKRAQYNKGLFIAGFIALMLYCVLGPIFIEPHEDFEEGGFELIFQGMAYLVMIGIANMFYTLGSLIDLLFNKNNSQRFRERLFNLGYWFSFSLPILLILSVMLRFYLWGE